MYVYQFTKHLANLRIVLELILEVYFNFNYKSETSACKDDGVHCMAKIIAHNGVQGSPVLKPLCDVNCSNQRLNMIYLPSQRIVFNQPPYYHFLQTNIYTSNVSEFRHLCSSPASHNCRGRRRQWPWRTQTW